MQVTTKAPKDQEAVAACVWISKLPTTIPSQAHVWRYAASMFTAADNHARGGDYQRSSRDRKEAQDSLRNAGLRIEEAMNMFKNRANPPAPSGATQRVMPSWARPQPDAATEAPTEPLPVVPPEPQEPPKPQPPVQERRQAQRPMAPAPMHRDNMTECTLRAMGLRTWANRCGAQNAVHFGTLLGAAACLDRSAVHWANGESVPGHTFMCAADDMLRAADIVPPWRQGK